MERSGSREIRDDRSICQAHTSTGGYYGRTATAAAGALIATPPRTSNVLLLYHHFSSLTTYMYLDLSPLFPVCEYSYVHIGHETCHESRSLQR